MSQPAMSMEAALDEERKSVLALLEGAAHGPRAQRGSASSAGSERAYSPAPNPRSPVRSMLDIAEEPIPTPRHASIAATNGGITVPTRPTPIRSMLDVGGPLPPPRAIHSAQTSPTEPSHKHRSSLNNVIHPRSVSDAPARPPEFGPRSSLERNGKSDLTAGYQFSGYLPSNPGGPVAPKRNTLAGKKVTPAAIAEAVRGSDLSGLGKDRGRNHSIATTGIGIGGASKSRSPHNRLGVRSNSPHASLLTSSNLLNNSSKFALDNGTVVDMNTAFRRLSDANLALAGGSLATLSTKGRRRTDSGDAVAAQGTRLVKDYTYEEDAVGESSDEDHSHSSDEEGHRGRKKTGRDKGEDDPESTTVGMGRAKGPRQVLSLMAAAEEERKYKSAP